jgi:putative ABC transport system permease protein
MRLNHVLRQLIRLPMFTTVAILTLAIGIGANAAIFTVIEGVLLKPLPFPHPDALVDVDAAAPGVNIKSVGASPFLYFTYRDEMRTFQDVALWRSDTVAVTGRAEPEQLDSLEATEGFLPALGVQPALGRFFSRADDAPGAAETVVVTGGYWRSKLGGDPSAVGRRLLVDGRPREIIGVLADTFRFLDRKPALVLPMQLDRNKTFLGNFSYGAIARLRDGVTIDQANADVARMIPLAIQRFPAFPGYSAKMFEEARLAPAVHPLKDDLIGEVSSVLWVLMGTIAIVLLIACANVANLLLVRADARQQELAIRAALGAGRGRLAKELLVESLTLGVLGGVAGLALAFAALRVLKAIAPDNIPRLEEISIDATVLLFTLGVSLVAGVLFGVVPVIKYARPYLGMALRAGGRTASSSRERHRARNTLVVVQVALALVLLISSGLMIRTFVALKRVHPGFTRPEEVQTIRISIPPSQVADPVQVVRMEQAIVDKIAALPGVSSVALSSVVPMTNQGWADPLYAADRAYTESQLPPIRRFRFMSPGLPRTLGASLIAGREFTWADTYEKRPIAMVSENLAREMWGSPAAALGKRVRENQKGPWREVVGVVSDVRDDGLNQKAPTIVFWPLLMDNFEGDEVVVQRTLAYVIRSSRTGSQGFVNEIGRAVWSVNPNLPLANVRTLKEVYTGSLARTSFTLLMLAIAGAMALLLGVAGIYGVISYSVSQRTREIGIRVALGARAQEVRRMFVGHGVRLAAIGVACGVVSAFAVMRLMSSLLFDVNPVDPLTYAAVSATLVVAAIVASYVPALRATAIDPVDALRAE